MAFDQPVGDTFEVAVVRGGGAPMTGAARVKGNRIVLVATGQDAQGRGRALKLTGRVNRLGVLTGRWVEVVEGTRGKLSGAFRAGVGTPSYLFL
jgi:hypothetical protein